MTARACCTLLEVLPAERAQVTRRRSALLDQGEATPGFTVKTRRADALPLDCFGTRDLGLEVGDVSVAQLERHDRLCNWQIVLREGCELTIASIRFVCHGRQCRDASDAKCSERFDDVVAVEFFANGLVQTGGVGQCSIRRKQRHAAQPTHDFDVSANSREGQDVPGRSVMNSELIFSLFDLVGLQFSPRIQDLADQPLYRFDRSISTCTLSHCFGHAESECREHCPSVRSAFKR